MPRTVRDLMTQDVLTVDPDMTLTQLDRVLLSYGVSGAPVVERGVVVGVVSRTDVVRVLFTDQVDASKVSGFYSSPFPLPIPSLEKLAIDSRRIVNHLSQTRVEDVMSRDLKCVSPDDDLRAVARLMAAERLHRVPVLEDGVLVGILSSLDLVRAVAEQGLAPT